LRRRKKLEKGRIFTLLGKRGMEKGSFLKMDFLK